MPGARQTSVAAALVLVAGLAVLFAAREFGGETGLPLYATVLAEPKPLPDFELLDQQQELLTRDSLRGQTTLLFFGFTHCPDICPATLQQLALARKQIAESGAERLPQILLISVDPERDTPEKLAEYAGWFGDGVAAASGSPDAIRTLTSGIGIFFEKQETGESGYTISHSTAVLVIDESASLRALFSAPHRTEYFANDIPLLMAMP